MIVFEKIMNIRISTRFILFYLCVNSYAILQTSNTMDIDAIKKLTTKLDLLEQKLRREHPQTHGVGVVHVSSNEIGDEINERWISDMGNRIKTLEKAILQETCDNKIQSLEETVQELSKQKKLQVHCSERTEKIEAIVTDQGKNIFSLKKDLIQIKKAGIMPPKDKNEKDKKTEDDVYNLYEKVQSTNVSANLRNVVSRKSKTFYCFQ